MCCRHGGKGAGRHREPRAPSTRLGDAAVPVAWANRRSASAALAAIWDSGAPHRLRPPSCPADRPGDLYGSIIRTFGITCFDVPNRRLTTSRNVDMLNGHFLLALAAVLVQDLYLSGIDGEELRCVF